MKNCNFLMTGEVFDDIEQKLDEVVGMSVLDIKDIQAKLEKMLQDCLSDKITLEGLDLKAASELFGNISIGHIEVELSANEKGKYYIGNARSTVYENSVVENCILKLNFPFPRSAEYEKIILLAEYYIALDELGVINGSIDDLREDYKTLSKEKDELSLIVRSKNIAFRISDTVSYVKYPYPMNIIIELASRDSRKVDKLLDNKKIMEEAFFKAYNQIDINDFQKECVKLHYVDNMPYNSIDRKLGSYIGKARNSCHIVRRRLGHTELYVQIQKL